MSFRYSCHLKKCKAQNRRPRTPASPRHRFPWNLCGRNFALLFEAGAEACERDRAGLQWVAHDPANVGVFIGARFTLRAVGIGDLESCGFVVVKTAVDRVSHFGAR